MNLWLVKSRYPKWVALVNGNLDQNLRCVGCILTDMKAPVSEWDREAQKGHPKWGGVRPIQTHETHNFGGSKLVYRFRLWGLTDMQPDRGVLQDSFAENCWVPYKLAGGTQSRVAKVEVQNGCNGCVSGKNSVGAAVRQAGDVCCRQTPTGDSLKRSERSQSRWLAFVSLNSTFCFGERTKEFQHG